MKTDFAKLLISIMVIIGIILYFNHKIDAVKASSNVAVNDSIVKLNKSIVVYEKKATKLTQSNDSLMVQIELLKKGRIQNHINYENDYKKVINTSGNNDCKWFDSIYARR